MARDTLVLDASVGVKWFSGKNEDNLLPALAIKNGCVAGNIDVLVPDLFFFEVANALVYKNNIPTTAIETAIKDLFSIGLHTIPIDSELMAHSINLSRQSNITVYDACYAAIAQQNDCSLVTANPRHQRQLSGCKVVTIDKWKQ